MTRTTWPARLVLNWQPAGDSMRQLTPAPCPTHRSERGSGPFRGR